MPSNIISIYDRIKEISYTMGTGNFVLSGAAGGFSSFSSVYEHQDNLFYVITDGTSYEVGSGTLFRADYDPEDSFTQNELKRFPIRSSNNNALVNFSEGTKEVFVTYPASHAVYTASGIGSFDLPSSGSIVTWISPNMVSSTSGLVWNSSNGNLGINKSNPQYGIDVGGTANKSIIKSSGVIVGSSGIYFSSSNGRQLSHYEPNQLDQYAYNNSLIGELTGSSAVFNLSGVVNQYILFKKQNAGTVFAGPPSGCTPPCSPGYPSFRPLVLEDIPDLSSLYVNSGLLIATSGALNEKAFYALNTSSDKINSVSGILNVRIETVSGIAIASSGALNSSIVTVSGLVNSVVSVPNSLPNGRLTLSSNNPVTSGDLVSQNTIYYTPYNGNRISLYDNTKWNSITFSQTSLVLSGLSNNLPYDIFAYNNNGTLALETIAWTSTTARNVNLVLQDGIYCKNGDLTRRYLGTFITTSTSTTEDSATRRYLWNMYNRVEKRVFSPSDSPGNGWTYSTSTWRTLNGTTTSCIYIANGLVTDVIKLTAGILYTISDTASTTYFLGIAKNNNTTSPITGTRILSTSTQHTQLQTVPYAEAPQLGLSSYYPVENRSSGGIPVLYGGSVNNYFGGIAGTWEC